MKLRREVWAEAMELRIVSVKVASKLSLWVECIKAVVTNGHKLEALNQQKFIFSKFWRPKIHDQRVSKVIIPSEVSREESFLVSFSLCWPLVSLCPWQHHFYIRARLSLAVFHLCVSVSSLRLMKTFAIVFKIHPQFNVVSSSDP